MGKSSSNSLSTSSKQTNSTWKRMFTPSSHWEDKDEFLDVIYWGRQLVSIVIGIIWGILGFTGSFGLLSYMITSSIVVYVYSVNVNDDSEDAITAVKEGFMTSLAAFLVTWILVYTYLFNE